MSTHDFHSQNFRRIQEDDIDLRAKLAHRRDDFLEENNIAINLQLFLDLNKYYDVKDIGYMIPNTVDFYVRSFIQKLCSVYETPALVDYKRVKEVEGKVINKEEDTELAKLKALLLEVNWQVHGNDNCIKMRLHNTIVNYTRYSKTLNLLYIENGFNIGTCIVKPYKSYSLEMRYFAYEILDADGKSIWEIWDRELKENYLIKTINWDEESYRFLGDKLPVPPNTDKEDLVFDAYDPLTTYRYANHNGDFWGNGFDSLINLVRNVNILLTVTQDDTVQEAIRILILNFDPTGKRGDKNQIKIGLRHPLKVQGKTLGNNQQPSGQILQADLYNEEIMTFIRELSAIFATVRDIPSPLRKDVKSSMSGIALAIENEPIIRTFRQDRNIVRKPDLHLITNLIKANNHFRGTKDKGDTTQETDRIINEEVIKSLFIEYFPPHLITDEKAEFELEIKQWEKGTSNPVKWLMKKNPGMSEEEAKEQLKKNKLLVTEFGEKPAGGLGRFGLNPIASEPTK